MLPRPAPLAALAFAWLGLLGLGACRKTTAEEAVGRPTAPVPASTPFPRNEREAIALLARRTQRRPFAETAPETVLKPASLLERAFGAGWDSVALGDGPVRARVQRFLDEATARGDDAYVLFGTFHDAEGQIDAFRRLVGPGGLRGLTAVTVEQLRATGRWAGVPEFSQLGDDLDIAAYLERGDLAAFGRLGERHRDSDYVAWKLGYVPKVLDLLVTARASSPSFWFGGCDMPTGTQELAAEVPEKYLRRLREIHCLDALGEATRDRQGPRRVAMLWGQAHLASLTSLLPPSAEVLSIYVLGFRTGPETLEAKLAPSLVVADPLLVPLRENGDEVALVYPDAVLGASVDRVHEAGDLRPTRIAFVSPVATRIVLADHMVDIVPHCTSGVCVGQASLDVPPGDHRYVATFGALHMAGAVHLRQGVEVEIRFDPTARGIAFTERGGPR